MKQAGQILGFLIVALAAAAPARAQAAPDPVGSWRIAASTGAWVPFSALIRAADSYDTRLGPAPSFTLEPRIQIASAASIYASATAAFASIRLGSSIQPAVVGPSNLVVIGAGTAGLLLVGEGWLGEYLEPTLRLGGGIKWYGFDLTGAENQTRPTADIGIGLHGVGTGPIEVMAEVRYLPSSFDQARLPTRGIATQNQRQSDVILSIGFAVRPG